MMDDSDRTTNVSTFQNLFEACERILVLKSDKKQKRNMYCWILWSAYTALVLIVFCLDKYAGLSNSHNYDFIVCFFAVTIAVRCQWDLSVHSYESQSTARILWNRYILNLKVHTCLITHC